MTFVQSQMDKGVNQLYYFIERYFVSASNLAVIWISLKVIVYGI